MSDRNGLPVVELNAAFVWDCDKCGRENFTRAKRSDIDMEYADYLTDEELDLIDDRLCASDEAYEGGAGEVEFLTHQIALAPATVTCPHCQHKFSVTLYDEEEEEDE